MRRSRPHSASRAIGSVPRRPSRSMGPSRTSSCGGIAISTRRQHRCVASCHWTSMRVPGHRSAPATHHRRCSRAATWPSTLRVYSPYEAAAWAVLSQRIRIVQAAALRRRLIDRYGEGGAFPPPATVRTLDLDLPGRKTESLHTQWSAPTRPMHCHATSVGPGEPVGAHARDRATASAPDDRRGSRGGSRGRRQRSRGDLATYLARTAWGRGIATEAARECVRYAHEDLELTRLVAVVRPDNDASRRVLSKLDFRHDHDGHHYDVPVQVWTLDL